MITVMTSTEVSKKIKEVALNERKFFAELLEYLIMMDEGKLYLELGHSSLFDFVLKQLNFSEHETYLRINAARTMKKFSELRPKISSGEINLTVVKLISPHITPENKFELIAFCKGKTTKQVEAYLKRNQPRPPSKPFPTLSIPSSVPPSSSLPSAEQGGSPPLFPGEAKEETPAKRSKTRKFIVEINEEEEDLLGTINNLLSHKYPKGANEAQILRELMKFYISKKSLLHKSEKEKKKEDQKEKTKEHEHEHEHEHKVTAEVKDPTEIRIKKPIDHPFPNKTPRIKNPMQIKRKVWIRDQGKCQFMAADGTVCLSSWRCEIDHVIPLAKGGTHEISNLRLLCRNHNIFMAEVKLGKKFMDRFKTRFKTRAESGTKIL